MMNLRGMSLIGIGNNDQSQYEVAQREHDEQDDCNDASIEVVVVLVDFHRDPPLDAADHDADRRLSGRRSLEKVVKNL
jgi:hypothetical protein